MARKFNEVWWKNIRPGSILSVVNIGSKKFFGTLTGRVQYLEFKDGWDALAPEHEIMRATIVGREDCDLTQR